MVAERAAMARDLHDVIAAHLSTTALHSGAALAAPPDTPRRAPGRDEVSVTVTNTLTRPARLGHRSLSAGTGLWSMQERAALLGGAASGGTRR